MPIYEYRCDKGHTFEVMQRMTDDALGACERCGASARRVYHPVAVQFKGSGFYTTDYGKKDRGGGSGKEPASSTAASSDSGSSSTSGSSSDSSD